MIEEQLSSGGLIGKAPQIARGCRVRVPHESNKSIPDLERMAEKIITSGLDPLNSILFSIAIEARQEIGERRHG